MRRLTVTLLAGCLLATGCTDDGQRDQLQLVENPRAATPADSPPRTAKPEGRVLPVRGEVTALGVSGRTLAVAVHGADRATVRMYDLDRLSATPHVLRVPGPVERLEWSAGGALLGTVPGADRYVHLAHGYDVAGQTAVDGGPTSVARLGSMTLVALRERKAVALSENEHPAGTISGKLASADQVLAIGEHAVVLDRLRSAVFQLDVPGRKVGVGLRAGQGATNAVADRFGRALVIDTRSEGLLAFSVDPLVLRQRYPVPGTPYGIAYDPERDLAWVTLTARNQVVGFDVAGGEPVEKYRFDTVRQPNSVAVDAKTGLVVVGSSKGEGIQVIEP